MLTKFDNFFRLLSLLILIPLLGDLHLGCSTKEGGVGGIGGGAGIPDLNRGITNPLGVGEIPDPNGGGGQGGGGAAAPGWQEGSWGGRRPIEVLFMMKFCPSDPDLKVVAWEKRGSDPWNELPIIARYDSSETYPYLASVKWAKPGETISVKFMAYHTQAGKPDCFVGETAEMLLPEKRKVYEGTFMLSNYAQCVPSASTHLKRCLVTPERFDVVPDKLLDSSSAGEADSPPEQTFPGNQIKAGATEATLKSD